MVEIYGVFAYCRLYCVYICIYSALHERKWMNIFIHVITVNSSDEKCREKSRIGSGYTWRWKNKKKNLVGIFINKFRVRRRLREWDHDLDNESRPAVLVLLNTLVNKRSFRTIRTNLFRFTCAKSFYCQFFQLHLVLRLIFF